MSENTDTPSSSQQPTRVETGRGPAGSPASRLRRARPVVVGGLRLAAALAALFVFV